MDKAILQLVRLSPAALLFVLGCGTGVQVVSTPIIQQVSPQTIIAGSQTTTVKVTGAQFTNQSVVLWNGGALATSWIDANTLSASVGRSSIATPSTAQLQVQNPQTMQSSQAVPITITTPANTASALTFSISSLPQGTTNAPYSATLSVAGGTLSYLWQVTAGQLPPGLALATNSGILAGTPTGSGSYTFTVTASDSSSPAQAVTASFTLTVISASGNAPAPAPSPVPAPPPAPTPLPTPAPTPVPLTIVPISLSGAVGLPFVGSLQATGGTAPYLWSVANLPTGLNLTNNGLVSGVPTASGTASVAVTVSDASSPIQMQSIHISVSISPAALVVGAASLPSAIAGSTYMASLPASGGTPPYSWSATGLPAGLTLQGNGLISGVATLSGMSSIAAIVQDSGSPAQTKAVALSITVTPAPLVLVSSNLSVGVAGSPYASSLQVSGGTAPYRWSVSSGALQAGLNLNPGTGVISGTPTSSGTAAFTVTVQDSSTLAQSQSSAVSLIVVPSPLSIASSSVASGTDGMSYSSSLQASGGTAPYSWSISSGSLPAGVLLNPATGMLSGTPTASGSFSFVANVRDSGSPAQAAAVAMSLYVAAAGTPLNITASALTDATINRLYSATLSASGGTAPYTWSIHPGSLPPGLTLAASTGVISGSPTLAGAVTLPVSVSDSGTPVQTQSAVISLIVDPAPLTITTSGLVSGTSGTAYSSALTASGGTPSYQWSISAGALPAGLSLAATTGVVSGTPTVSGTSSFTATVSDNGNPVQTKSVTIAMTITAAPPPAGPGTTWFVRTDGGTRYSPNVTSGQCDGKADAAYPGTGTNQHCAFNDFRYMWDDDSGQVGAGAWIIAGGDTVVVRGCTALSTQQNPSNPTCRIGWDVNYGGGAANNWCADVGSYTCYNPPIPAGTAAQHTRILGGCAYGTYTCTPVNTYPIVSNNLTQIFGGFGLFWTFNLGSTSYVDVEGIELTTHNGVCTRGGAPAYPRGCSASAPVDDYAQNGFLFNNTSANVTLQDVYIHGFNAAGLYGPIGGAINLTRVFSGFSGFAGWNFQDNSDTPNAPSASIIASYVTMEGNGCYEQYPIVNTGFPARACYDDVSSGFGDSWSGQDTNLASFTCDHCVQMYNTKDGFIGPHAAIGTLTITNSTSIGNMGQQWKWGTQTNATTLFENNVTVGNCARMSLVLPGAAQSFALSTGLGGAYLSDFCRAAGDTVDILTQLGSKNYFYGNTIIMADSTGMDLNCGPAGGGATNCGSVLNLWENNNFLGYTNPGGGEAPGLWYVVPGSNVVVTSAYNNEFGIRNGDPCGVNHITCSDPLLRSEPAQPWPGSVSDLDSFNPFILGNDFYPAGGSPLVGAGTVITELTTDYYGVTRPSAATIGAVEP